MTGKTRKMARKRKNGQLTPELECGKNYIYAKFLQGFNYIVAPRQSGKTTAAKMIERTGSYNLLSCPSPGYVTIDKKLRGTLANFIFDEFEFFNMEKQLMVFEIYATMPSTVNWVFLTSPRNVDLDTHHKTDLNGEALIDGMKNHCNLFNALVEMQKIRKHVITKEKLLAMNRLMSL